MPHPPSSSYIPNFFTKQTQETPPLSGGFHHITQPLRKIFAGRLLPARLLAHTRYVQVLPSPNLAVPITIPKPCLPMVEKPLISRYHSFFIHQAHYRISRAPKAIESPAGTPSIEGHHRISPIPKAQTPLTT